MPNEPTPTNISAPKTSEAPTVAPKAETFPSEQDAARIERYEYFEHLFDGNHFEAFNIKAGDDDMTKAWHKLRYTVVNYAGLISKLVADMLFSEPVKVSAPDGDQAFIEGLWRKNSLNVQLYESALSNSYKGDALFKLRVGFINPKDKKTSVIIEDTTPNIYFPEVDGFNVRANPQSETLAWTFKVGGAEYLRKEIHKAGTIENKVYKMEGNKIGTEQNLDLLGIEKIKPIEQTKVDFSLLEHVVNWKTGNRFFGVSDYYDVDSLFFALNNRMSKIDNILDKHSDPILTVPPGILDEKGRVKKSALGVIEIGEGETGKPEYVVWDASLENAFKQIEKLVEFMYLVSEVSPDAFGMGQGQAESGRALKYKLMRTIAKVARKKLYYDAAIKSVLYKAQVLAKEYGVEIDGKKISKEPVVPELVWSDGLPNDYIEQVDTEIKLVDAGLKSKKRAIIAIEQVDEETAEKELEEIDDESAIAIKNNPIVSAFGDDNNPKGDDKKNDGK